MRKIIRTILLVAIMLVSSLSLVACNGAGGGSDAQGLILKKYNGEDFYTVTDYVDDGKTTVLNIESKDDIPVGRIAEGAFKDVSSLTEIVVPATVTEIGAGAFKDMTNLNKLTVPFIGKNANADATLGATDDATDKAVDAERTLAHFFGTEEYEGGISTTINYNSSASTSCYIPATLNVIALNNQEEYKIPMYAFSGVTVLRTVILNEKVTEIGEYAFNNCVQLGTIVIPKSVEKLHEGAFYGCTNLSGLSFATGCSIFEIGDKAFYGISKSEFIVPASVMVIGEQCFATATIKKINLSNVSIVGYGAFSKCEKLTTVTASANTVELGTYAFYKCSNLKREGINLDKFVFDSSAFVESGINLD